MTQLTPSELITRLTSWFLRRDRDITLPSGRTIVVTSAGVSITIDDNGIVITGGDVTIDGTSVSVSGHAHTHASTTGQTVNDHHNESHTVASHSDTTGTGAELNELTDGSETTLHIHDGRYYRENEFSNYSSGEQPLKSNSSSGLNIGQNLGVDGVILGGDDIKADGGLISGSNSASVPQGVVIMLEVASVGTPSSGFGGIYFKSGDSRLYYKNDAGTEYGPL